jgi:hypothetical protein
MLSGIPVWVKFIVVYFRYCKKCKAFRLVLLPTTRRFALTQSKSFCGWLHACYKACVGQQRTWGALSWEEFIIVLLPFVKLEMIGSNRPGSKFIQLF